MNTTIGKSFGLALLMAIGVVVTMLALGMFSAKPAGAGFTTPNGTVSPANFKVLAAATTGVTGSVAVSPGKARSIGQYTITVTGTASDGMLAVPVGGSITIKFNTSTTVPSSIASSAVKLKASIVDGTGIANQLVSAGAVTVSGKSVIITVPDMDPGTGSSAGDNGISADGGVTVTFTQAAGIQNPNQQKVVTSGYTLEISTSSDTSLHKSAPYAITAFVSFSPSTGAARGATVTVTGGGFTKNCDVCNIRVGGSSTVRGTGTIDANGVFSGEFVAGSGTKAGGPVNVTDSAGLVVTSTTSFVQKAGATPRSTSASAGSVVSVDLIDFTAEASNVITQSSSTTGTTIGTATVAHSPSTEGDFEIDTGETAALTPYKFVIPAGTATGTHVVKIRESASAGKSATFNFEVVSRVLTVTPATASPGQSITVSGTGFTKDGKVLIDFLTAASNSQTVNLNFKSGEDISIDGSGNWSFATRMPVKDTFGKVGGSTSVTIEATDNATSPIVGKSSGFKRTKRTLTLSPSTAGPGQSVVVSVTGMTVDNGANTTTATFTISGSAFTASKSFPVGTDGAGTGVMTIKSSQGPATAVLITATDNADVLNPSGSGDDELKGPASGRTATANLKIPNGTITVTPGSASTGNLVTVTGSAFPPNTTGSILTFGGASGIPAGGFITDNTGSFSVIVEIPAASTGGSLSPGSKIVVATVGSISGSTTAFSVPSPSITITPSSAAVEETIVITGTGFNSLGTVSKLDIGSASVIPSPAPRAARNGDITAAVIVPLLNPGTYTVTMTNGTGFSASATFTAVASKAPPAASTDATETVFADVIANGDNLVRVWRFSNADQSWAFYDPRPAFELANTLTKTGAGDIVWVNVNSEQDFQSGTLFPGWNLISLK